MHCQADAGRVTLASMPFSPAHHPSLALGLLKPLADPAGAACDVGYFSLDYLEFLGPDVYAALTEPSISMAQAGEWMFAAAADPRIDPDSVGFLTDILLRHHPDAYRPALLLALLEARRSAGTFIKIIRHIRTGSPLDGIPGLAVRGQPAAADYPLAMAAE